MTPYSPGPTALTAIRSIVRPLERAQRLVQVARRLRQLTSERQPAEERQRRLLAFGPVDRPHPAGAEPELEQLRERVGVVAGDLALVDGGDDVGQPRAALLVLHHRRAPPAPRPRATSAASPLTRITSEARHQQCSLSRVSSSCSRPPLSIEQWMPHSFGAPDSHHQRPARLASPGAIARVHGAQPIDV